MNKKRNWLSLLLCYAILPLVCTVFWRFTAFAGYDSDVDRYFADLLGGDILLLSLGVVVLSLLCALALTFTYYGKQTSEGLWLRIVRSVFATWHLVALGFVISMFAYPLPMGLPNGQAIPFSASDSLGTGAAGVVISIVFFLPILGILWLLRFFAIKKHARYIKKTQEGPH